MPLRHHSPDIDTTPATLSPGLEYLDQRWVAVLRSLNAARLDYVLVGPAAEAIRGEHAAAGPVAIVPAPYLRNLGRLAVTRESLRAAGYALDVENAGDEDRSDGARYQELLYESNRIELAPGLVVEVAALEDLEHFAHLRRTGTVPEFRITRTAPESSEPQSAPDAPASSDTT